MLVSSTTRNIGPHGGKRFGDVSLDLFDRQLWYMFSNSIQNLEASFPLGDELLVYFYRNDCHHRFARSLNDYRLMAIMNLPQQFREIIAGLTRPDVQNHDVTSHHDARKYTMMDAQWQLCTL
jgi:hypothetical protein